jgi:hypothetical protein
MDEYSKLLVLADIRRELWFDAMASRRGGLAAGAGQGRRSWLASLAALALAIVTLGRAQG